MSRNSRPASICAANAAGGTGKTAVAITVTGTLDRRGHGVLFVDPDPQGGATAGLGLVDTDDARPPTLFDAVTDPGSRETVGDPVVPRPGMDVVPSNVDTHRAERGPTLADVMAGLTFRRAFSAGQSTFERDQSVDAAEAFRCSAAGIDSQFGFGEVAHA